MEPSLVVCFLVWILGGFANITTGMGGSLIALPLLVFFVDLQTATVVSVVAGTLNCFALVARFRRFVDRRTVRLLLLGGVPGVALGVLCLKHVPLFWLEALGGATLAAFAAWQFLAGRTAAKNPTQGALVLLAGGAGGGFGFGAVGLPGPPMAVCAYLGGWDKDMARGVFGYYFVPVGVLGAVLLWLHGLMTPAAVEHTLAAVPGMIAGTLLGIPASRWLPQKVFRALLLLAVLAGGLALLYKAFLL